MPQSAYNRTVATIRDYPRIKDEIKMLKKTMAAKAQNLDGMPKAQNRVGSSVEDLAIKIAERELFCETIDKCLEIVPEYTRDGIMNHVCYGSRYPYMYYGPTQWKVYNRKFIYAVADKLNIYKEI